MINNAQDLQSIKQEYQKKMGQYKYQALICGGTGCVSSGCAAVEQALKKALDERGMKDEVAIIQAGCIGTCAVGPIVYVLPDQTYYTEMTPKKMIEVVDSHFRGGRPIEQYTFYDAVQKKRIPNFNDIVFYQQQARIALRNCGLIDVTTVDSYIASDGYLALADALQNKKPQDIVKIVKDSGLRGRGGGGFPTGVKWEACANQKSDEKYMICNADEGDPGAFMDRGVFEGDPHSVIEGMLLGGYAIGANNGYIYIRAEYPIALQRLREAIEEARNIGVLGKNIMGSGFDFDLEIRIGAGAFVCGEETALMASVEGKRGEPNQKPPFPFEKGLFGSPSIINNVETLANIPQIVLKGAEWFRGFGTKDSPGTKVFALTGHIENTGLVEVPMGMQLGDLLFQIGGGVPDGRKFKAAQTGGPSGGCITPENLNIPMDYEHLAQVGSIMGSGGLIVMNEDTCMVDTARFYLDFIQEESCGKCTACRIGTKRMLEILERITEGEGKEGDIELLEQLSDVIRDTAMCGLGQTAPNPVLATIKNFHEEYEEHIHGHHCRAGVCDALVTSPCENTCPAGINIPGYISLIATENFEAAYKLIMQDNPFPGVCGRICTHPCESRCRRATVDEAMNICELKRFVSDYVYNNRYDHQDETLVAEPKGKKIAIVGAGPSGLTCGYYLVRLGYEVDVFEAEQEAGGVLYYGIPSYRLPKDIIKHEVEVIEKTGVKIHLNTTIGKDITLDELREKYDAVYLAAGAQKPVRLNIEGENLKGVYHGLDFLREVTFKGGIDFKGKTVAVIGGGNSAIDSARTAIRLGAQRVTVLYRRTKDEMPADKVEISDAEAEGIEIIERVNPAKILGSNGKADTLELMRMYLGPFDASGRRSAVAIPGSNFFMEVDAVVVSVSQQPEMEFASNVEIKGKQIAVDKYTQKTNLPGVFAGGDLSRGTADVVYAIHDGKLAAANIDKFLGGLGVFYQSNVVELIDYVDPDEVVSHPRYPVRKMRPEEACQTFEECNLGLHKLDARAEAMRCLRCDRR